MVCWLGGCKFSGMWVSLLKCVAIKFRSSKPCKVVDIPLVRRGLRIGYSSKQVTKCHLYGDCVAQLSFPFPS